MILKWLGSHILNSGLLINLAPELPLSWPIQHYIVPTKERCIVFTQLQISFLKIQKVPPLKMSSAPLSAFFPGRILSQLPKKDVPLFGRPSKCSGHNADLRQHITDWYDPSFGSTSHSLPPGLRGTLKRSHSLQSGHPLQGSGSWRTWKNHGDFDQRHKSHKVPLKDPSFFAPTINPCSKWTWNQIGSSYQ